MVCIHESYSLLRCSSIGPIKIYNSASPSVLGFFQDFLGGNIYCYSNFYGYTNFSIFSRPDFGGSL